MIRFSKKRCLFAVVAMIFILIFITGIVGLSLAQTTQDSVLTKDKSSNDMTKEDGLFGSGISLKDLGYIGTFLCGIAAILALILRKSPSIQIVLRTSEDISKLLKGGQTKEFLRFEKLLQSIEQNSKASFVDKAITHAYRLQADEKIDEALQKWRDIANYAEGDDNDLAARAWFSVGYLLTEQDLEREALAAYDKTIHLKPDYAEAYNNRGTAKNSLVVVQL